jgi:hypothetical protein
MKVTLTNADINFIRNFINENGIVGGKGEPIEFSLSFAWKLRKNIKNVINPLYVDIQEKRRDIDKKYSDPKYSETKETDKNGNVIGFDIKPEYIDDYRKEVNEFMGLKNEIEIDVATIDEVGVDKISIDILDAVGFMLVDDSDEE